MTLHVAIEKVLAEKRKSMTTVEIADRLNSTKWYERADKGIIPTSQVASRVVRNPRMFKRIGDKIYLVNW